MEDVIIRAVGNIGFPAVISLYLLCKFDKTMSELTQAINNNTTAIKQLEQNII